MIDLILEGQSPPPVDQVVGRSGVSQASLFRYFGTLDELRKAAIGRYFERFDELLAIPALGTGPLPERITRLVAARAAFYMRTAPMARLARRQATDVPELAATLDRVRALFADQIARHFASELDRLDHPVREQRVAVLAALTSFETWDQLAALGRRRRTALHEAIGALLTTH